MKYSFWLALLCLAAAGQQACNSDKVADSRSPQIHEQDLTPPSDALFKKLPASTTGIDFRNTLKEDWAMNSLLYPYLYNSAGIGILDVNNDGLQDVFFAATLRSSRCG